VSLCVCVCACVCLCAGDSTAVCHTTFQRQVAQVLRCVGVSWRGGGAMVKKIVRKLFQFSVQIKKNGFLGGCAAVTPAGPSVPKKE